MSLDQVLSSPPIKHLPSSTEIAWTWYWTWYLKGKKRVKRNQSIVEQSDIEQEILAYLVEHPRAQDTLEGIMQWWLLEQEIKRWMLQVQAALTELVAQGVVVESQGKYAQIRYRINRRRLSEIRARLKKRLG
jgi:hypothetical protein